MKDGPVVPRYTITHKDGKPLDPETRLFVLSPDTDPYAVEALKLYSRICRKTHPELSCSIIRTFGLQFNPLREDPNTGGEQRHGEETPERETR